ncbi:MAG: CbtB domain-containing protein [Actinomycetota bacterium]
MPMPVVAWLVAAIVIVALLAMLQGQFSVVHEFVHDARHFTGVPCH